ncbi:DUF2231 domain-containing protein [Luteipulveratus flavus]|uniref:DUF2231 domain-containing protein n=1 Tax=Luteipulveratus flavus TaxID=3031728 RepID=A0ABT6C4L2_9MICO|nr:DUF2231 domain-containing protein [Luteipulveratus sp. YIM 133296]MDF8263680.1 hypothetical protein [Luteipulveratus sp. YIM 133296]
MFDKAFGLPVHVLIVHAVVVLGPIAALLAIAYAVRPAWRLALRWPLVLTAPATGVASFVAAESGEKLEERVLSGGAGDSANARLIHDHTEAGDLMKIVGLVFMVVALAAVFWLLRPPARLPRVRDDATATGEGPTGEGATVVRQSGGVLSTIAAVLLVLVSLGTLYQVVITGHSGSKASWSEVTKS